MKSKSLKSWFFGVVCIFSIQGVSRAEEQVYVQGKGFYPRCGTLSIRNASSYGDPQGALRSESWVTYYDAPVGSTFVADVTGVNNADARGAWVGTDPNGYVLDGSDTVYFLSAQIGNGSWTLTTDRTYTMLPGTPAGMYYRQLLITHGNRIFGYYYTTMCATDSVLIVVH